MSVMDTDPQQTPDPNPPQQQPGSTPPQEPQQPPPGTPQLSADVLAEAMVKAYRTAVPAAPMTPPPAARDFLETLTPQQREGLSNQFLTDPIAAARFVADGSARHTREQLLAEAQPLVANQAQMIVDMYVQGKVASTERGQEVAQAFRAGLQGVNLMPLVGMSQSQRDHELDMRWNGAYGQVAQKYKGVMTPPKPDPILTATPAGGGAAPAARKFEADPALVAMAKLYNFTPEQIREVEEAM